MLKRTSINFHSNMDSWHCKFDAYQKREQVRLAVYR